MTNGIEGRLVMLMLWIGNVVDSVDNMYTEYKCRYMCIVGRSV